MNTQTDISTPLVKAFAFAWSAIQRNHPEVPDVVITFGAGSKPGGQVYGHFAPHRWERGESRIHELFVGGEGLERGAEAVMGTLLHEAAHGLAIARNTPENPVQDVSRGGRYHNSTFKALGEEVGISLTYDKQIGWSSTTITEAAVKRYAAAIRRLDAAIVAHRRDPFQVSLGGLVGGLPLGVIPPMPKGRGRASQNNGVALVCECETPRRIRVAPSVIELGPITCGVCGQDFQEA